MYLAIVNGWSLDTRKQIRHNPIEERQILRGQLGYVHILHGQKQNLKKKNKASNNLPSTTQRIQWLFSGRRRWRAKQENNVLKATIRRTNPKDSFTANKCVQYVQSSLIEKGQEENVYIPANQNAHLITNQNSSDVAIVFTYSHLN